MKKSIALVMCLVLCFFTACKKDNVTGDALTLYFVDSEKQNMVTEQISIPSENKNDILAFAVNSLINGPKTEGYKKAIPDGTTLLGIELSDNIATVNLSSHFNTGSRIDKLWSRYTLVSTLCGIEGVSKTQILVEGDIILSIASNEPLGPIGKDEIVTDISQIINDSFEVKLYFTDSNAMYLVPEKRTIELKEGENVEKAIVEALFHGPVSKELYPTLPQEVKVLSTETKDGVCFVNLSAEFAAAKKGGTEESLAVYSIVNTLCELDDVKKVQLLVEGKKFDGFGHLNLSESLEKNDDLLE